MVEVVSILRGSICLTMLNAKTKNLYFRFYNFNMFIPFQLFVYIYIQGILCILFSHRYVGKLPIYISNDLPVLKSE